MSTNLRNVAAIVALFGTGVLAWRLHVTRGELSQAREDLFIEKAQHGTTAVMITECGEDLAELYDRLEEREAICKKGATAYREAANLMYRCEQKQCRNNWVPEERHYQCMSALWDVDEKTANRLEMEDLEAARDQNEKAARATDKGISFVTVALYDKCVEMLHPGARDVLLTMEEEHAKAR